MQKRVRRNFLLTGAFVWLISVNARVFAAWSEPIVAGTTLIRKVHISELRDAINAKRSEFGFGQSAWTNDPIDAGVTLVRKVHITQMRNALTEIKTTYPSFSLPTFDALNEGVTQIRAVHVTELRDVIDNPLNTCRNSCGSCKQCSGSSGCTNQSSGFDNFNDCPPGTCRTGNCNGAGGCGWPSDDAGCGTIDCDGLDSSCRDYFDITANRCEGLADCKDANTGDCSIYNNAAAGSAGIPACGTCKACDGAGGCNNTPADDAGCGSISCASLNDTCKTYSDITTNRCASLGTCKTSANCTTFTPNTGTDCGTCTKCDGSGNCSNDNGGLEPGQGCDGSPSSNGCFSKVCYNGSCYSNSSVPGNPGNSSYGHRSSNCGTCKMCDGNGGCSANVPPGGTDSWNCIAGYTSIKIYNSGNCGPYSMSGVYKDGTCNGGGGCNVAPDTRTGCDPCTKTCGSDYCANTTGSCQSYKNCSDGCSNTVESGSGSCGYRITGSRCSASVGPGTMIIENSDSCNGYYESNTVVPCCINGGTPSCGAWSACSTTCGNGTQSQTCTDQCGVVTNPTQSCTDNSGYSNWHYWYGYCSGNEWHDVYYNDCGGTSDQNTYGYCE